MTWSSATKCRPMILDSLCGYWVVYILDQVFFTVQWNYYLQRLLWSVVDYENLIPQTLDILIMGSLLYSLFNFTITISKLSYVQLFVWLGWYVHSHRGGSHCSQLCAGCQSSTGGGGIPTAGEEKKVNWIRSDSITNFTAYRCLKQKWVCLLYALVYVSTLSPANA